MRFDLAVIQLLDGRPADAEQTLRGVRDNFDHLEQSDAVEYGVSMVTDDQRLAYAGELREDPDTRHAGTRQPHGRRGRRRGV